MLEMAHHKAVANGVRLHYVTAGSGDPVVLLHGWPQTWHAWRHVIPPLAGRYSVIAPDLRGLGDSERPESGYDAATLAEDVHGLLRRLGLLPAHLVGHDLGGPVAYALAAGHRDAARTLALLECPLPGLGEPPRAIPGTGEPLWHFAFHACRDLPEALIAGRERLYMEYFFRHFAHDPAAIAAADVDEYVRSYAAPGAMRAAFEQYRAIPRTAAFNAEAARRKLTIPVLALGGEACLAGAVLESARFAAADAVGGAVGRCGHWIPEERPDELVGRLLEHFARAEERS